MADQVQPAQRNIYRLSEYCPKSDKLSYNDEHWRTTWWRPEQSITRKHPDPIATRASRTPWTATRVLMSRSMELTASRKLPVPLSPATTLNPKETPYGRGTERSMREDPLRMGRTGQYIERANMAFKRGDFAGAARAFTQAIEIDPDDHFLYSRRAACFASLRDYERAKRDAEIVQKLRPDNHKGTLCKKAIQDFETRYERGLPGWETCHETLLQTFQK